MTTSKKIEKTISNKTLLLIVLAIVILLSLVSETTKTIPVESGEYSKKRNLDVPRLNSDAFIKKFLSRYSYQESPSQYDILLKNMNKADNSLIENLINYRENILANSLDNFFRLKEKVIKKKENTKKIIEEDINEELVKIAKIKKPISRAPNLSNASSLLSNMEEIAKISISNHVEKELIAKKITAFGQVMQNPKDLKTNYKFARQQFQAGNVNEGINTLKRMIKIYPNNNKIKFDLIRIYKKIGKINEPLALINEIKKNPSSTENELQLAKEFESSFNFVHGEPEEPSKWSLSASISFGLNQDNNVGSVSKTRLQSSDDALSEFGDARFDKTYTSGFGLTAFRFMGERSSLMINTSIGNSDQVQSNSSDYDNYGAVFALDTYFGNQNFAPYLMMSKYENKHSAEMLSYLYGFDFGIPAGKRNKFSFGYSFSNTKYDHNSSYPSIGDYNSFGTSYSLSHNFYKNDIISTSTSLTYSDSDVVVDAGNDLESYELGLSVNFAYPWAYISVGNTLTFTDYKKIDTSINSNILRSDAVNTVDLSLSKAVGDFLPLIDPKKNLVINISYEKVFSESNIINYDYIDDAISLGISKSISLDKN
ncbi:tetratricopeptide repeat protein [Candidatus Pelagibacter sp.]|nr:tetratricopeptide repeat protein [Candidatus Pelagibacter sp.]